MLTDGAPLDPLCSTACSMDCLLWCDTSILRCSPSSWYLFGRPIPIPALSLESMVAKHVFHVEQAHAALLLDTHAVLGTWSFLCLRRRASSPTGFRRRCRRRPPPHRKSNFVLCAFSRHSCFALFTTSDGKAFRGLRVIPSAPLDRLTKAGLPGVRHHDNHQVTGLTTNRQKVGPFRARAPGSAEPS